MKKQTDQNAYKTDLILEEMEARQLFSGGIEGLVDTSLLTNNAIAYQTAEAENDSNQTEESTAQASTETQSHELVFVDTSVEDYQAFVDDLINNADSTRNFEIILLESDEDGIDVISQTLQDQEDLDAVHIISHGSDGEIQLGNTSLNAETLADNNLDIALWANAFSEDGDILIYGCNLAETELGQSLVNDLSELTLADVAASDDLTGDADQGGDWELEFNAGTVEAEVAVSEQLQNNWNSTLAITEDTTSTGTSASGDFSISHTTSGTDRLMLVSVSITQDAGSGTVSSITYNGTNLTLVGAVQQGDARTEIWSLTAPDVTTANVDITFSGTPLAATAGVVTYTGVDQSSPLGSFANSSGEASSGTVNVGSATDEVVFAAITVASPTDYNLSPGAGQTELWDLYQYDGDSDAANGGASVELGDTSVDMSWSWGDTKMFAIGSVSINSADGLPTPLGHWTFDTDASDSSINNYDGTLAGDAFIDSTDSTDKIGDAKLSLDGSSDYVDLSAHISSFSNITEGTISAWINTTDTGESVIFDMTDSDGAGEIAKFSIEGGQLKWLTINDTGAYVIGYSDALVNDGNWHHVAVTVGPSGNALYIDGVVASMTYTAGDSTESSFLSDITGADSADIGRSVYSGSFSDYNGLLDDVRLYGEVLTPAQLAELAITNKPPVANDDSVSTNVDTAVVIDVVANDADPEGDAIIVVDVTDPANGSVVDNGDGTITYTPDAAYTGSDSFEYTIIDSTAGAQHYWGFDGNADDGVGSSNGTLTGTTTVAGSSGNGLSFNETSDQVNIPDVTYASEFSISFDFKLDDNSGSLFQYLYSHGDINSTNSVNIFLNESSHGTDPDVLRTVIRDSDDTLDNLALQIDIASIIGDGNWHNYTVTVGADGIEVYLDGVLQATDATRGTGTINPAGDVFIGVRQDLNADRRYGGSLDSLQIYNTALTNDQVTDISSGSNRATVNVTVNAAPSSAPPVASGGNVIGIEDQAYIFNWQDFNISDTDTVIDNDTAVRIDGIPADGSLQYYNGNVWIDVSQGQLITKSIIDSGALRFMPDLGESGHDGYGNPGTGDGFDDYAQFTYSAVHGIPIAITNSDAESDSLAEGNWTNPATGWITSGGADGGSQNITPLEYATDHDAVLYVNGGATLTQTLGTNFSSSQDYSLTIEAGWRGDAGYPTSPDFRVELWAGGTRIGFLDQTDFALVKGEFVSGTLSIDGSALSALNGQALEIRLVGITTQSNFDNISLTSFTRGDDVSAASANMIVDITPINLSPINSVPPSQSTNEDTSLTFNSANSNLISIADETGTDLTVTLTVSNGSLTLSGTSGLTLESGAYGSSTMTISGSVEDINTALDGLQYDPTAEYSGADTLSITTTDSTIYQLNIDANLQGFYEFTSGASGVDSSPGGTNGGSLNGDATVVNDAEHGDVMSFDGSGDSVQISGMFSNPPNLTLAAWVNIDASASGDIISLGDNVGITVNQFADSVSGLFYNGSSWEYTTDAITIDGDGWHHIAYVFDDTNNTQVLYIDGVAAATTNSTNSISYSNGSNTFIGTDGNGLGYDIAGLIDDVRIYDQVLTSGDIANLANAPVPPGDSDTLAITVNAINDAPVVDLNGSNGSGINFSAIFTEDSGAVAVTDTDATISDIDNATFQQLSINLSSFADGDSESITIGGYSFTYGVSEVVVRTVGGTDFEIDFDGTGFTIMKDISGDMPTADVQTLIRGITYENSSQNPTAGDRDVDIQIQDANGLLSTLATSTITVNAANDAPEATGNTVTATEDVPLIIGAGEFNFTDAEGDSLQSVTITGLNLNGGTLTHSGGAVTVTNGMTITAAQLATLTFTSASNDSTNSSFTYTVNDADLGVTSATMNITVNAANDTPTDIVFDDGIKLNDGATDGYAGVTQFNYGASASTQISVEVSFASTTIPASSAEFISYAVSPGDANEISLFMNSGGDFRFITAGGSHAPFPGFDGTTLFDGNQHQISVTWDSVTGETNLYADGVLVSTMTTNVGDNVTWATGADTSMLVFGQDQDSVGGGFNSGEIFIGDIFEARIYDDIRTAQEIADNANNSLANPGADANLLGNWIMTDNGSGMISDLAGSNDLTLFGTASFNTTLSVLENSGNGSHVAFVTDVIDVDTGDTHSFSLTDSAGGAFAINSSTGEITVANTNLIDYESATSMNITVRVTDGGGLTYDEVVTINVMNVNETPVNTVPGAQSVDEDTLLAIGGISVTDSDGNLVSTQLTVTNGTLNVSLVGGASISSGANGSNTITLNGTEAQINAALATLTYQGNTNYNGSDTLTVLSTDSGGIPLSDSDTVAITVNAVNNAPTDLHYTQYLGGSEFVVNTTTTDSQDEPEVVTLSNGTFVVVWESTNQDGSGDGVYFQIFDANGVAQGSEVRANVTTTGDQDDPQIVALSDGGFAIIWESDNQDGSLSGIFGRIYDATGTPQTGEFSINTTTPDDQLDPDVAALTGGGFVVVWESNLQDGDGKGIYSQIFDNSGATIGSETLVNTTTAGGQFDPTITALNDGGYIIAWDSNDGSSTELMSQRFDASGTKIGTESQINTFSIDTQDDGVIATLSGGGYVAVWESQEQDGDADGLFGQLFDAGGNPVGGEFSINSTTAGSQEDIEIIALSDGGFLVVWQSVGGQDGDADGIYAQQFDANGNKINGEFLVNLTTTNSQADPSITLLQDGRLVVVYESFLQDGSGDSVIGRIFTPTLNENSPNGTVAAVLSQTIDADVGDTFTYSLTDDAGGAFTINSTTGTITIADTSLIDYESATMMTVTVRVTDSGGLTHDEVVTIFINDVNDLPVATGNTVIASEDVPLIIGPGDFSFTDDESDSLQSVTITGLNLNGGTLTHSGGTVTVTNGMTITAAQLADLTFTSALNDSTNSSFSYTVNDAELGVISSTMNITVNAVNDAPTDLSVTPLIHDIADNPITVIGSQSGAQDTSATLADGNTVTISISGGDIVAQIFDPNGIPVTAEFIVIDDADSDISVLSNPVVAALPDGSFIVAAQAEGYIGSGNWGQAILAKVFDSAGNALTVNPEVASLGGYIIVSNTSAGNTHQITPTLDVAGDGTITVSWNNTSLGQFEERSFQIIGPSVDENAPAGTVVAVLNAADPDDGDTFSFSIVGGSTDFEIVGNEIRVLAGANLDFETTPTHTVTIRVTDSGGLTYDETITISVNDINETPVNTVPCAQAVNEDAVLNLTGISVTDVDGNLATTQLTVSNGALNVSLAGGATISAGANGSNTLTLSGTEAQINAALATLSYQGNLNFNGSDNLTVLSIDSDGSPLSDTDNISITVNAVNDAPVLTDGATISNSEGSGTAPFWGVSTVTDADSADFDGGVLTATISAGGESSDQLYFNTAGSVSLSGSNILVGGQIIGTWTGGTSGTPLAITFNADADVNEVQAVYESITFGTNTDNPTEGIRTISVTLTDGDGGTSNTATASVNLSAVNDEQLLATNTGSTVAEGSTGNVVTTAMLETTDVDNTSAQLVYTVDGIPANGILYNNGVALAVNDTFTQADIDAGLITYDHDGSQTTADGFDFTVDDGAGTTTSSSFSWTVTNTNDAPVNTVPGAQSVDEDTSLNITGISVNDVDGNLATTQLTVSNGALNVSLAGGATISAGANGSNTLTLSGTEAQINAALATLSYQGNLNFNGSDTLTVLSTDSDGTPLSDSDNVSITVNAVNDAPVATGNTVVATEDTPLIIGPGDFSFTDAEGNSLQSITITGLNLNGGTLTHSGGTVSVTNGMTITAAQLADLTFTSALNDSTNSSFTYTVNDADLGSVSATMNITVNPAGDPAIIGGTDTGVVTEDVGVVGNDISTSGTLSITDPDAGESTFQAGTIIGTYGDLTIDTAGNWSYVADNTQAAIQQLDTGESMTDTITVTSFDGTTHNVVVTINGAEDGSVIGGTTTGSVTEDGTLTSSGTLTITDTDVSDPTDFVDVATTASDNGYGTFAMTGNTWTFTLDNNHADVQALDTGESLTDTFTFTAPDGTTQQVTVTINGAEDAPVFDSTAVTAATENSGYSYAITTSDIDIETVSITAPTLPSWLTLIDNGDGTAILAGIPTNAEVGSHSVVLNVSDGSLSSNQSFTIVVANTNDSAVIGGADTGAVTEDVGVVGNNISTSGTLTITDPDVGESTFQAGTITGTYGDLTIDTAGNWSYVADNTQAAIQQLDDGESMTDTITVTSFDGTTHNVVITINGAEDGSVIGGTTTGSVTEDGTLTSSGTLTITDTDTSDPTDFVDVATTASDNGYGTFAMTGNTWTFTLDNNHADVQALDTGESLTDTFTFTAPDGTTQQVTVTINGAEDTPIIGGVTAGVVTEDGITSVSNSLTITDADSSDNPVTFNDMVATDGDNGYGTFEITGNTWAFNLDNANPAVQALDAGESLSDSFTFIASDGSSQTVTVTINGTEDTAVISGSTAGSVSEDGPLIASGSLTISDIDTSDNPITLPDVPATGSDAGYGTFIFTSGTWTYTLDNSNNSVQALGVGDTLTDTITLTASDGSTHVVTIIINGANDLPIATSNTVVAIEDIPLTINASNFYYSDIDGDALTSVTISSLNLNGGSLTYSSGSVQVTNGMTLTTAQLADLTFTSAANDSTNSSFVYVVNDADPGVSSALMNIQVNPADDVAIISGTDSSAIVEDQAVVENNLITSGQLTIVDFDTAEASFQAESVQGQYGILTIDSDGSWTYVADNSQPAIQSLNDGDELTDSVIVKSVDGTTHNISVTIFGAREALTITPGVPSISVTTTSVVEAVGEEPAEELDALAGIDESESFPSETTLESNEVDDELEDATIPLSLIEEGIQSPINQVNTQNPDLSDSSSIDNSRSNINDIKTAVNKPQNTTDLLKLQAHQDQLANQALIVDSEFTVDTYEEEKLLERIDEMQKQIDESSGVETNDDIEVKVALSSSLGLTTGFIAWILRGGSLLASMMTTLPLLNRFDPLPIVKSRNDKEEKKKQTAEPENEIESKIDKLFSRNSDDPR